MMISPTRLHPGEFLAEVGILANNAIAFQNRQFSKTRLEVSVFANFLSVDVQGFASLPTSLGNWEIYRSSGC